MSASAHSSPTGREPESPRRSRGLRRRIRRWWRESALAEAYWRTKDRLSDWWYPVIAPGSRSSGYHYGTARRSRFKLAIRAIQRFIRSIPPLRLYRSARKHLNDWWHPEVRRGRNPLGGYVTVRKSRLTLVRNRFSRRLSQTWFARGWLRLRNAFNLWCYPDDIQDPAMYRGYGVRRLSRAVLFRNRLRRRFRETWVGRLFGRVTAEISEMSQSLAAGFGLLFPKKRLRRFLWRKEALFMALLLCAAGVLAHRYLEPGYLRWVEGQYARQAETFLSKGDFSRAYIRSMQVLQINPNNALATRINAEIIDYANAPTAVYWRKRAALLDPSITNRLALAATALRAEEFPFKTATETLQAVEPIHRQNFTYHSIAAALALKLGRLTEAEQHYTEALKLDTNNVASQMSLAVVRLQSRDPKLVADSRITLELLSTAGKLGVLPLRSLVAESLNIGNFERALEYSTKLIADPQAGFADHMLHLTVLNALNSPDSSRFLVDLKARAAAHPGFIGQLAEWLTQRGRASEALEWLNSLPANVTESGFVPVALADCYIALKRWHELGVFLDRGHWPGLEHVRLAMLNLATRNETSDSRYNTAWQRALNLAEKSPPSLNLLCQLAFSWGWLPEAEELLWRAAKKYPDQGWPLPALQKLYMAQRNSLGLVRVFRSTMQQEPENKLAQNNYAMLALLLRFDEANARSIAASLFAKDPTNPVFASTQAMSLHLQGKTGEGLAILKTLTPEQLGDPSLSAYYGILLAASGQRDAARPYLARAEKAFLMPEEESLVKLAKQ